MEDALALYIHIPFCLRKCLYCDFYSIDDYSFEERFVNAAITELSIYSQKLSKPKIKSIFFGGGTPTSLNIKLFKQLFDAIISNFSIIDNCEITIECNPATSDEAKLSEYLDIGVNRLSIGVQSFNNDELKALGRLHDAETAEIFIQKALAIGFNSISIDLIIALPNQNLQSLEYTLSKALSYPIEHISVYTLILEPDTKLYDLVENGEIKLLDENAEADLYAYACESLINAGYEQYEISNFAKNKKYSFHNLNYWDNGDYIGIGPSAHGSLNGVRYSNFKSLDKYIQSLNELGQTPIEEENILSAWDKICETFFLGFRAIGVDIRKYQDEFNLNLNLILEKEIALWQNEGLLCLQNNILSLSSKGRAICDELSAICLEKIEKAFLKSL